jgi:chromosome segregation ATPase
MERRKNNNLDDEENIDEYYDYLPADHPLYTKMQAAIEDQLKEEEEELRLLHKEKSEESKKIKRTREDIGINLYSCQQRYAKLEEEFNENYMEFMAEKERREKLTKQSEEEDKTYRDKFQRVREQEKIVNQAGEELNQLNSMLRYIENYNKQVESEIKVTSTTGHVVEKKIRDAEREKNKQDFFIDYLSEQIKNLTEKKLLYEAQLKSQKEETKEARQNLYEAQSEIENILERKRNLLKDWDKSLLSMKTRDKALQVVRDNIQEQESEKLKYTSQIARYNDLTQNEIFINNNLQHEIRKIALKQKVVDNQIQEINSKRIKLDEKRLFLQSSLSKTKEEIHNLDIKNSNLNTDIKIIDENRIKLLSEANALEEKNFAILSSKETYDKQTENLIKLNTKLEKEKFDLEVEKDAKENEIARVEIDRLNVETQNAALKNRVELMEDEIKKFASIYNMKDQKIQKIYKDLGKKQLSMDKLNKEYGELTKHKGGEDEGVFEIKIKALQAEIQQLNKSIQEAEHEWIQKKTILVNTESLLNTIQEECYDKKSKEMILEHKKLRLKKNYELHDKEINEIEISLKNLRYDMSKYNVMLGKNVESKDKLEHKFFDVEIQFKEKLKQMENESVRLEIEIEVLREEKTDTLTQILEVERQIHLWERKIQLEEKMQEIIKPDKGIKEIDKMKSDLHKQDLKYKRLKQEQEKVIKSMEMAIQRRDFIKLRYPSEKKNMMNGKKDVDELKDHYTHLEKKIKSNESIISKANDELNEVNNELENIDNQVRYLQENITKYKHANIANRIKANNISYKAKFFQDASKDIEDYEKNKVVKRKDEVRRETENVKSETEMLLNILVNFSETNPEYKDIISIASEINKI